jgi:IMP dehydrogenase
MDWHGKRSREALALEDVLLVAAQSSVVPCETDAPTHLTPDINLNSPIVDATIDSATEGQHAVAIARGGGIGILHRSMSIDEQAQWARRRCSRYALVRNPGLW